MKALGVTDAINNLRAKADIVEELNQRIESIRYYDMHNGEIEYDWQAENNDRYQAKIDVLQSLIEYLIK